MILPLVLLAIFRAYLNPNSVAQQHSDGTPFWKIAEGRGVMPA